MILRTYRAQRIAPIPAGREIGSAGPSLRAVGRLGGPGIFGPGVSRVAAAQLLANLRVGALPEAAQVTRRLDGRLFGASSSKTTPTRPGPIRGVSAKPNCSWSFAAATIEPSSRYRGRRCVRWAGQASGARRSRRARVPASSQRSGSSRGGRLVRPWHAVSATRCRSASSREAQAAPQAFRRLPSPRRSSASAGWRGGPGPGDWLLGEHQPVVPVRAEPDRSRRLVEAVHDFCGRPRATPAPPGWRPALSARRPPRSTPLTSSARSSSPSLTPLAPEDRAHPEPRTAARAGLRRRATRSGKPASNARRSGRRPSSGGLAFARSRRIHSFAGSLSLPVATSPSVPRRRATGRGLGQRSAPDRRRVGRRRVP
jgi:hypothetical protein